MMNIQDEEQIAVDGPAGAPGEAVPAVETRTFDNEEL